MMGRKEGAMISRDSENANIMMAKMGEARAGNAGLLVMSSR